MRNAIISLLLVFLCLAKKQHNSADHVITPSLVPITPTGYAVPCSNRTFWGSPPFPNATAQRYINIAAQCLAGKIPFPAWNNETYLIYNKTGSRKEGEAMISGRNNYIVDLAFGECFEFKGRFIPALEAALLDMCKEPSWTLPAHDPLLQNFYGIAEIVELNSATMAGTIGEILYLLKGSISSSTAQIVYSNLRKRVLDPIAFAVNGSKPLYWWMNADSNWNAVCLSGVALCAASTVPSPTERAFFLEATRFYSKYYLGSFTDDGYGTEGVGYYNYGFGHYAQLRETLLQQTQVDLFSTPKVANIALFAFTFPMRNSVVAQFGDDKDIFSAELTKYIEWSFGLSNTTAPTDDSLQGLVNNFYLSHIPPRPPPLNLPSGFLDPYRAYFNVSKVLVMRAGSENTVKLDMTIKILGNGFGHSHNDIGSYDVNMNGTLMVGDPGGPLYYEARTFDNRRFLSPLMNSLGHPVPFVNGKQQLLASDVAKFKNPPTVLISQFTPLQDTLKADITSSYNVSTLTGLFREVVYSRKGNGLITLTDTAYFTGMYPWESVVTTSGSWTQTSPNSAVITKSKQILYVYWNSTVPFKLNTTILSDYNVTWTRLAIQVKAQSSSITVIYSPTMVNHVNLMAVQD